MALTRKLLKGMPLNDEQMDIIIEAHTETIDALKEQVNTYKAEAEKVPGLEKKIEDMETADGEDWKAKYEKEHSDFDAFKNNIAAKETAAACESLFRAQLTELGVTGKRADQIVKATDMTAYKIKDGAYEDAEAVKTAIREDWSEFIPTTKTEGAKVDTPPKNTGGKMTRDQIAAIKDPAERRAAIAENMETFERR